MRVGTWAAAIGAAAVAGAAEAQVTAEFGGRLLLDAVTQEVDSDDPRIASGRFGDQFVRTARLSVEGDLGERWSYEVEAGVRDGGPAVTFEDVVLEYRIDDRTALRLGNFRTFSLEALTSLNDVTFMSRGGYHDLIQADRTTALEISTGGERWGLSAAAISDSINEADDDEDTRGLVARGWIAPEFGGGMTHLGAWTRFRDGGGEALFRYRNRNNTAFGERYIDTRAIFESDRAVGVEAAWVRGPWSVQGEAAVLEPEKLAGGPDGRAYGGYAFVSWFVTGESRTYDRGEFDGPEVRRPLGQGGWGALELAVRRGFHDVGDFAISSSTSRAGRYDAWTFGATWYPTERWRVMANAGWSRNDAPGGEVDVETLQARVQYAF